MTRFDWDPISRRLSQERVAAAAAEFRESVESRDTRRREERRVEVARRALEQQNRSILATWRAFDLTPPDLILTGDAAGDLEAIGVPPRVLTVSLDFLIADGWRLENVGGTNVLVRPGRQPRKPHPRDGEGQVS